MGDNLRLKCDHSGFTAGILGKVPLRQVRIRFPFQSVPCIHSDLAPGAIDGTHAWTPCVPCRRPCLMDPNAWDDLYRMPFGLLGATPCAITGRCQSTCSQFCLEERNIGRQHRSGLNTMRVERLINVFAIKGE